MNHYKIFRRLQDASSLVYRLIKFKDNWGKTFTVIPFVPYEEYLAKAIKELGDALEESGQIGLEAELRFYTSEQMKKESIN